jgi:hypothetical protein
VEATKLAHTIAVRADVGNERVGLIAMHAERVADRQCEVKSLFAVLLTIRLSRFRGPLGFRRLSGLSRFLWFCGLRRLDGTRRFNRLDGAYGLD